jgi:succinyl-CoA synthetase alpha subunit
MSPTIRCLIRRDTYRDSVELMRVAVALEQRSGVARAALLMGTPANRDLLSQAGLLIADAEAARPNDLVVVVQAADEASTDSALVEAERLLSDHAPAPSASTGEAPPHTISEALATAPTANLAIISTPGAYAAAEALKALKRGLHVFLFSDNVPIDEEIELKRLAGKKGLLMMGPDCGTAIVDGVPLGFANAVRRGQVGLVGASGTGLQQVSCLVDRVGEGVSQLIGVGGHDLEERVGGFMMLAGIERLATDEGTSVIVLVAKPPSTEVARHVLDVALASGKPVVVNFLGGDAESIRRTGAVPAATLEDAARFAVALARNAPLPAPASVDAKLVARARAQIGRFATRQRHVHGLFSGGTLCQEAALILEQRSGRSAGHSMIDLGDDEFTVGRPHPMIDFRLRNERIVLAAEDATTAVVLLDVVLGYGAHPDPAPALVPAVLRAREGAERLGHAIAFIASVCGTPADPQDSARQEETLEKNGVILASSNAQAARLAAVLVSER